MIEFETFVKKNKHNIKVCNGQTGLIGNVNEEAGVCELEYNGKTTKMTIPETVKTVLYSTAAVENPSILKGWRGFAK